MVTFYFEVIYLLNLFQARCYLIFKFKNWSADGLLPGVGVGFVNLTGLSENQGTGLVWIIVSVVEVLVVVVVLVSGTIVMLNHFHIEIVICQRNIPTDSLFQ